MPTYHRHNTGFRTRFACLTGVLLLMTFSMPASADPPPLSHTRPRPAPQPSTRPAVEENVRYVDVATGKDADDGSAKSPWRTVQFAITQLHSGDTLYLRKGTYFEHLSVSVSGKTGAPITIRSFPGEIATLDGGMPEFEDAVANAWEPVTGAVPGEYRSKHKFPNLRDIVGAFGDSLIGLQTYWHREDLEAANEFWNGEGKADVPPVYCGPGIYYDAETGYIYARLAPTHLQGEADNYTGETDPRKLPLILAPFRSVPLHVDQGNHLRFEDLVIRGGGYDTIVLDHAEDISFDNVIVYCGTYGMRTANTRHLKFFRSALYGNTPPWGFRTENSLRNRRPTDGRDVARLTGHALWVGDTGLEYSIYAYPTNDDFEISYSTFTDCHDGLYLGGIGVKFHHNVLDNMQDDGIYVSPVYDYGSGELHIYQNYISRVLTAFAFGGPVTNMKGHSLFIYRNVVDLRQPVRYGRPSTEKPVVAAVYGNIMGDHGSPPWTTLNVYQNTFIVGSSPRVASMGVFGGPKDSTRTVINNAFVAIVKMPAYSPLMATKGVEGGNLYYGPNLTDAVAAKYFEKAGNASKSVAADPKFANPDQIDFRPKSDSPLINAGMPLPPELPDPLHSSDAGAPDIGALPLGAAPLEAGVAARP